RLTLPRPPTARGPGSSGELVRARGAVGGVLDRVASLDPACFAFAMATGIVSLAAQELRLPVLSRALFALTILAYAGLWALTLVRLACYPARAVADLTDHARGPGFFSAVAATGVLGVQILAFTGDVGTAIRLWLLGLLLWLVLTYTFFGGVIANGAKPDRGHALHGGWLLTVVATESLSVLGVGLASGGAWTGGAVFLALVAFLLGTALYGLIIGPIFSHLVFTRVLPADLTPAYWINMGALAITTLAGTKLIAAADRWPVLQAVQPFL